MKFNPALLTALFAAAISAAPAPIEAGIQTPTVSIINDMTGRACNVQVPADGTYRPIPSLCSGSPIDEAGKIKATSAQLTNNFQHVECAFETFNSGHIVINDRKTWTGLPGELNNWTLGCYTV